MEAQLHLKSLLVESFKNDDVRTWMNRVMTWEMGIYYTISCLRISFFEGGGWGWGWGREDGAWAWALERFGTVKWDTGLRVIFGTHWIQKARCCYFILISVAIKIIFKRNVFFDIRPPPPPLLKTKNSLEIPWLEDVQQIYFLSVIKTKRAALAL